MNGIVEADEMYFLESFKGQRHLSYNATDAATAITHLML